MREESGGKERGGERGEGEGRGGEEERGGEGRGGEEERGGEGRRRGGRVVLHTFGVQGCMQERCVGCDSVILCFLTFEATMKRVVSGESFLVTSARWVPSMLET